MNRFTVKLVKTAFSARAVSLPEDLILTPERWSATDRGGMESAEIVAAGSAESLAYLMGWLGDRVEIYNEQGDPCFWGVLWDMDLSLGNITVSLSMDNVYNRVAVIYPFRMPDGTEESRTTDWAEDPVSVQHFGKRELLYSMPSTFSQSAASVRDQLLGRFAQPSPIITSQRNGGFNARLGCAGLWKKTNSIYFRNMDGLIEHTDGNATQVIGRYYTSNAIAFGDETPANGPDDMYDGNAGFGPLQVGDTITISGAANVENNGTFTIGAKDSNSEIETEQASFVDAAAGPTIKISYGDGIAVDNVAQAFQITDHANWTESSWTITHVALRCRKLGEPSDNFRIALYPDNGGVPGTFISAIEVPGSTLATELAWTEFPLVTPIEIVPGTTYWLQVRRSGTANLADGYEVSIDEDLGYVDALGNVIGDMLLWNGSSWVTRDPDAHLSFRLIGEIRSTEQLSKALSTVDDFVQKLVQFDSGIDVRQFSDDERTAMAEIEEMLDAGTEQGYRLIAWVTFDSTVIVNVPELSSGENLVLDRSGKLRYAAGGLYPPGRLVFGQYVDIDSVAVLDSISITGIRGPSFYVQKATYDALTDTITLESDGDWSPWDALKIKKG